MATKLDQSEIASFKELLIANSIQIDSAVQLMIEKGLITEQEYFTKFKQINRNIRQNRMVKKIISGGQTSAALVLAASFFVAVYLGTKAKLEILALQVLPVAKHIFRIHYLRYYALANGIKRVLRRTEIGMIIGGKPISHPDKYQFPFWGT